MTFTNSSVEGIVGAVGPISSCETCCAHICGKRRHYPSLTHLVEKWLAKDNKILNKHGCQDPMLDSSSTEKAVLSPEKRVEITPDKDRSSPLAEGNSSSLDQVDNSVDSSKACCVHVCLKQQRRHSVKEVVERLFADKKEFREKFGRSFPVESRSATSENSVSHDEEVEVPRKPKVCLADLLRVPYKKHKKTQCED